MRVQEAHFPVKSTRIRSDSPAEVKLGHLKKSEQQKHIREKPLPLTSFSKYVLNYKKPLVSD